MKKPVMDIGHLSHSPHQLGYCGSGAQDGQKQGLSAEPVYIYLGFLVPFAILCVSQESRLDSQLLLLSGCQGPDHTQLQAS